MNLDHSYVIWTINASLRSADRWRWNVSYLDHVRWPVELRPSYWTVSQCQWRESTVVWDYRTLNQRWGHTQVQPFQTGSMRRIQKWCNLELSEYKKWEIGIKWLYLMRNSSRKFKQFNQFVHLSNRFCSRSRKTLPFRIGRMIPDQSL